MGKKKEYDFECDNCGTGVLADATICPGCGCTFVEEEVENKNSPKKEYDRSKEKKKSVECKIVRFFKEDIGAHCWRMELLITNNTPRTIRFLDIYIKFYKNGNVVALDKTLVSNLFAYQENVVTASFLHVPDSFDYYEVSYSSKM